MCSSDVILWQMRHFSIFVSSCKSGGIKKPWKHVKHEQKNIIQTGMHAALVRKCY